MFWKKKASREHAPLEPVPPPVRQALVLICEKCGKKLQDGDANPSKELQSALKSHLKDALGKRQARPLLTSCFDLCPDRKIAVALVPLAGSTQFFEIEKADQASVLASLTRELAASLKA